MKQSSAMHTEEFILRELFRGFDRTCNGIINNDILKGMLNKVDLTTNDEYIESLLQQVEVNG